MEFTKVPYETIRSWLKHLNKWGEAPWETRERVDKYRRTTRTLFSADRVERRKVLHEIYTEDHDVMFLDEFAIAFTNRTGRSISIASIYRTLTKELNLSLRNINKFCECNSANP